MNMIYMILVGYKIILYKPYLDNGEEAHTPYSIPQFPFSIPISYNRSC